MLNSLVVFVAACLARCAAAAVEPPSTSLLAPAAVSAADLAKFEKILKADVGQPCLEQCESWCSDLVVPKKCDRNMPCWNWNKGDNALCNQASCCGCNKCFKYGDAYQKYKMKGPGSCEQDIKGPNTCESMSKYMNVSYGGTISDSNPASGMGGSKAFPNGCIVYNGMSGDANDGVYWNGNKKNKKTFGHFKEGEFEGSLARVAQCPMICPSKVAKECHGAAVFNNYDFKGELPDSVSKHLYPPGCFHFKAGVGSDGGDDDNGVYFNPMRACKEVVSHTNCTSVPFGDWNMTGETKWGENTQLLGMCIGNKSKPFAF